MVANRLIPMIMMMMVGFEGEMEMEMENVFEITGEEI